MERYDFEKLVEEALEDLPREFAEKLENVEIVLEDEPTLEQRQELNLHPQVTLFGLYKGIPKVKRGSGYTFVLPDKITIFQKTIERFFHNPEDIKSQVRKTVLHEIGHHFGLSEESLHQTKVG
ncbi:metallopeptidase family protein [Candidatus Gottesmanbacteria bacterium]|nr:metallopeptidase family protein [Candidatus Gottesmanbacteria bacterium]